MSCKLSRLTSKQFLSLIRGRLKLLNVSNPFPLDIRNINSLSVDWFTGLLYWASSTPPAIVAGLSDGRGYVKILEKNLMPEQLTVSPGKR